MKPIILLANYSPTVDVVKLEMEQDKYDIWVMNSFHAFYERLTNINAIFNMHRRELLEASIRDKKIPAYLWTNYVGKYNSFKCRVIVPDDSYKGLIDNYQVYPIDEFLKEFDANLCRSSCIYMMALAYLEGYRDMRLMGISGEDEYANQLPANMEMLKILRAKGVKISCTMEQVCLSYMRQKKIRLKTMEHPQLYGYEELKGY